MRASLPAQSLAMLFAAIFTSLTLLACSEKPDHAGTPTVVNVVDGDTIAVAFGERVETIRLLGVDTPETSDPTRPMQCFGQEATEFLRTILPDGTGVRLERDVQARDHFGRLLGYVHRLDDDLFVNAALVEHGFADVAVYEPNDVHAELFRHLLLSAQTAERGLWGTCGGADVALDPPLPTQASE